MGLFSINGNCAFCGKVVSGITQGVQIADNQVACIACIEKSAKKPYGQAISVLQKKWGKSKNWPVEAMREMINEKVVEYKRKCNSCGNVYFFTQDDLDTGKQLAKGAIWSSVAGVAGSLSGNYTASAVNTGNAANVLNNLVDYNKCPKCNSIDTRLLSDEEWEREKAANTTPNTNAAAVSSADEIKKFKELLDSGVITQAEFDAKKSQLLGL